MLGEAHKIDVEGRDALNNPTIGSAMSNSACDVAEVLGAAIALNLLFHIPLEIGVLLTALDVGGS